ncbi:MAG: hypothetical protein H6R13_644 [Proteobacteria bacterium]|nr:hypothetical protein [Pseudomonadota bacterium]
MSLENQNRQRLDLASWRFKPGKLGCLEADAGEIEFKPLTLVCGPNNTGKTWVMYALYGFLRDFGFVKLPHLDSLAEQLIREGQVNWDFGAWLNDNANQIIVAIQRATQHRLPSIFRCDPELVRNGHFDWEIQPNVLIAEGMARSMDFRLEVGREKNDVLRLVKGTDDTNLNITLLSGQFPDVSLFLSNAIARHLIGNPPRRNVFLMPAERNGLHLFYRELANRRTTLFHHATKKDKEFDIGKLIQDVVRSRYAEPIADYIDWLNDLPDIRKKKGPFHELAEKIKQLVGGRYDIDAEGDITFTPKKKRGSSDTPPKMDLHLTSSTVKSLFGLWAYLEFDAQPGDVLMIDEPELNLHPSNQRQLARLLARMANSDLRVVISTHSDYLVREMNSLIMLSNPGTVQKELMQRFSYSEEEILNPKMVGAWLFCDRRISPMEIDATEGINAETFDKEIHSLNETSDDIYYAYQNSEKGADK